MKYLRKIILFGFPVPSFIFNWYINSLSDEELLQLDTELKQNLSKLQKKSLKNIDFDNYNH